VVAKLLVNKMAEDIAADSRTPLIAQSNTVRQRSVKNRDENKQYVRRSSDWDPNLPYGGKVYLARRKKPDPWWITTLEVREFRASIMMSFNVVPRYYYLCHL